jgi:hypothetical protein
MKRYLVGLMVLLVATAVSGCGYRTPDACYTAIFKAVSKDNSDAFFKCVLTPSQDEKRRRAVFHCIRENYKPYLGGAVMSRYEVPGGMVILNISPSPDYISTYGSTLAPPPLALAFIKENGYKLDLSHTQELKELHEMYEGLMR